MGTRIFQLLRNQKQSLKVFVNHASTSIHSTRLLSTQRPRIYRFNNNQPRRNKHCSRVDVCGKKRKKQLEEEEKARERESSIWGMLFGVKRKKPPLNTCRRLQACRQWEEEKIPEFITEMCKDLPEGSAIYKTKGHAFLVEVPCNPKPECKLKPRDEILLAKIERDKRSINLEDENNPMPCDQSNPGIRWIDLNNRRLHPLYKKMEMPTGINPKAYALQWKKQCKGDETEICPQKKNLICFTWDHLRRKENFSDVKMGVLPRYIQLREQEYMVNRNSSLETRKEKFKPCNFRKCPMTECPAIDCERWKKPPKVLKKKI